MICLALICQPKIILAQAGLGPTPYCFPQYSGFSRPCNQPGVSNAAGNSINDFINDFYTTGATFNISNLNSGCNSQIFSSTSENYYFVACPIFLRVQPGQNITCNFRSGTIYDQGFAVFIDWNQNGTFNLPGERVCAVTGLPPAFTWTTAAFTVPATQAAGTYRMRVRCAYVTTGGLIDPCTNYSHGETEDYRLIVGLGSMCGLLPVELIHYSGLFRNGSTELAWTTASEKNSDYFLIERSYDNSNFELVGKVAASGNSNYEQNYSLRDENVRKNTIVYYRLRQFDKGNIEALSEIITLYTDNSNIGFEAYPNPVTDEISLVIPDALLGQTFNVEIIDINGTQVYRSESFTGDSQVPKINISKLKAGNYVIRLSDQSGILTKKIIIKQ
jgi:hypothetical protein